MNIETMVEATATAEREALERLGEEIAVLSAHISVATARLLVMIRDFDAREGWAEAGARSCAEWLSWRVSMDIGAAREHVRVARALPGLPLINAAFAGGELSYSKVRALTRVATVETEARLLTFARSGTASHVERLVRGWRRVDRNAENKEAAQRQRNRSLRVYPDADGMVVVEWRDGRERHAEQVPVREVKCRSPEFQRLFLAELEVLGDCQILVQLRGLAKLGNGRREIAVDHIRRLEEGVFVDVRTRRIFRVPSGV